MKKYVFAFLIWVMIIPIAILNGGFREYVLVKFGGLARPLSGIILSVCIFIVAYPIFESTTRKGMGFGVPNLLSISSLVLK